jgi:hypothetical protein
MKEVISKREGKFILDIKKSPYQKASCNLMIIINAEEIFLDTFLAIKKEVSEPIMEKFVQKYDTNG